MTEVQSTKFKTAAHANTKDYVPPSRLRWREGSCGRGHGSWGERVLGKSLSV